MSKPELFFQKINCSNIEIATAIRQKVWPHNPIEDYYRDKALNGDPANTAWLVYCPESQTPIGITGVYTFDEDELGFDNWQSIWMDWFAVLPEFRGHGYGEKILLQTMEYCKGLRHSAPDCFKFFRLDTTYFEGRPAVSLYDKVLELREDYTGEEAYQGETKGLIYSKSLDRSISVRPWNNQPLGIGYISRECDIV